MKQNSKAWRRAVVPAAFAAAIVAGAAGPALAEPGPAHGYSGSDRPSTSTTPKTGDGATTFSKPNSWQAQADPDGTTNGGVDQPGGSGGTATPQDGNNGSGNDPDCEDDNRGVGIPGHCKTKPHANSAHAVPAHQQSQPAQTQSQAAPGSTAPGQRELAQGLSPSPVEQTLPVVVPATQVVALSGVRPQNRGVHAQVAGLSAFREPALSAEPALLPDARMLPNTGAPGAGVPLAAAGAVLVAGGAGLMLRRRSAKAA